ncbi:MAG TPA: GDSL-type esterase/lipase family protein, partial [Phycisphaerales bacterium]|nr:GDSL-type esterase/lipase family protein [Phycisphaerales bacterium]
LVFLGDSITEAWGSAGREDWKTRFEPRGGVNAGIGGDRTEHVLWRLDHGLLDAMRASKTRLVVVMIGTNNSNGGDHSAAEIAEGIAAITDRLTVQGGDSQVLLLGVFPRGERVGFQRRKIAEVNALISRLNGSMAGRVHYMDIGAKFLDKDGWAGSIPHYLMPDHLHLSTAAYTLWADAVEAKIAELLGEPK